jgi:hypothetical protein
METKYKIVRDNWTDCHSGTVKYAVGETFTVDNPSPPTILCGRGLHACHKPEDTMQFRYGWPVHLLEVQTDSIIAQDEIKCRCKSLTVTKELPLALCFGPNGEAVAKVLDELKGIEWFKPKAEAKNKIVDLMQEHFKRLEPYKGNTYPVRFVTNRKDAYAARDAARDAARAAAWAAARAAARDAARDAARAAARAAAWDAARDAARAAAWAAARAAARAAAWDAARDAARAAAWAAAWDAARDAARDAADYTGWLLMQDRLTNQNPFEPLMGVYKLGGWPIGVVNGEFVVMLLDGDAK